MTRFSEAIITRVRVQGFRSLLDVNVELKDVTVLVGPNGSGKSSFVDALSFLHQCLTASPQEAFKSRGGVEEVRTRTGQPADVLALETSIRSRAEGLFSGTYFVRFNLTSRAEFSIAEESCEVSLTPEEGLRRFEVRHGRWVKAAEGAEPQLAKNRLALPLLSGIRAFAPIYNALTAMRFYAITPGAVSTPSEPGEGEQLAEDGSNAASVLKSLEEKDETLSTNVVQALSQVVPSVSRIIPKYRGRRHVTLTFEEALSEEQSVTFNAISMSAGTLRVLGILLAIYQAEPPTLIGLEEPETAIHPGAAAGLAEALQEAGLRSQILVTTHSPDLVTRFEVDSLRAVERKRGLTVIAPISEAQRASIIEGLFTAGELHRIEGLRPIASPSEGISDHA